LKKTIFVLAAVLTLVLALGAAGYAYAQTLTPPQPYGGMMSGNEYGHMNGMMNGQPGNGGMMGGPVDGHLSGMMNGTYGPMHEYMVNTLAEALGLTPEELQSRIDAGETMWDVALAQGLSEEEISILMQSAHNLAIEKAVADGVITQEQADWMNNHMQQMHGDGAIAGGCH